MSVLELRCTNKLLKFTNLFLIKRNLNNKAAVLTKIKRPFFFKQYPVKIVQPDGSSFTIRYFEPRKIIKLPLNLSEVSEEERKEILEKRKVKQKVVIKEDDWVDNFNSKEYLKKMKKQI